MISEQWRIGMVRIYKKMCILAAIAMVFVSFTPAMSVAAAASGNSSAFIFGTPISTPVTDLNPFTAINLESEATSALYATSLLLVLSSGQVLPWLATGYNITNGGKTITFNINPSAVWIQKDAVVGPITAQDVVYTFQVLMANTTLDFNNIDPYIVNITAINPETVQFNFNTATVMLLTYVGTQAIIPYAWHSHVANASDIGDFTNMNLNTLISGGPFYLSGISSSALLFDANTHFWKGSPHVNHYVIVPYKSTSSMTLALDAGEIDAEFPAISDYYSLATTPHMVNVAYKAPFLNGLWVNLHVAPYNNTYFRMGLEYAINKTAVIQKAEDNIGGGMSDFGGETYVNTSWIAPGLPVYSYNVTMAAAMFEKAGLHFQNGYWAYANNTTVTMTLMDAPISDWMSAMTMIENDFTAVGLQASEQIVPFSTWASTIFSGQVSSNAWATYFSDYNPWSNPYYDLWSTFSYNGFNNIMYYNNATVNALLNESVVQVSNYPAELNYLFQAQRIIASQVPVIMIGSVGNYYVFNSQQISGVITARGIQNPLNLLSIRVTPSAVKHSVPPSPVLLIAGGIVAAVAIAAIAAVILRKRGKKNG